MILGRDWPVMSETRIEVEVRGAARTIVRVARDPPGIQVKEALSRSVFSNDSNG